MKYILMALILSVFISCNESPKVKFERDGISLICPKGWNIADEENIDDEGYYISIEKDGFGSSGIITITWVNDNIDLYSYLDAFKENLKSNIIYKNSNLIFEPVIENEFNSISSISSTYKVRIIGMEHEGIIHIFFKNNKTIAVLKQEAVEDRIINKTGFEIIERSFSTN